MGENKGTLFIPGGDLVHGKRSYDAVACQGEDRFLFPSTSQSSKIVVDPEFTDDILKREEVSVSMGGCWYGGDAGDPFGSHFYRDAVDVLPEIPGCVADLLLLGVVVGGIFVPVLVALDLLDPDNGLHVLIR